MSEHVWIEAPEGAHVAVEAVFELVDGERVLRTYPNRIAAVYGYKAGQAVWLPVSGRWTAGAIYCIGTKYIVGAFELDGVRRIDQFRPWQVAPRLEGDKPPEEAPWTETID